MAILEVKNVDYSYQDGEQKRYILNNISCEFEKGKLLLEDLRQFAIDNGEAKIISGRQEYFENLINRFIWDSEKF